jgi:hypothetical protein
MKHTISNNTVRARGETSTGMWIVTNEVLVENNEISTEKQSATGVRLNGAQCQIIKNKIEGMGASAIFIGPVRSLKGSNNRCEGNDLSAFRASEAEVVLAKDSKNNVLVGSGGKAKDLGMDNQITGLARITE